MALPDGSKNDQGKPRWSLLPWDALAVVVDVLEHGAATYGVDNWRSVKGSQRRYFDAAQRHLIAWWGGELTDPESGLPHLGHAACCVLFLLAVELDGPASTPTGASER